ncbi:MAG: restriction system protein [Candidatus Poribacteria bacterium]|nr:restriction system protein [Candidatus Poribacteria bacterium]
MINIVIPRQILKELQVNLTESEFREFFHTLSRLQSNIIISWEKASEGNIIKYQNLGCKLGDAAVASNLEELGVEILISENRHFLKWVNTTHWVRYKMVKAGLLSENSSRGIWEITEEGRKWINEAMKNK